MGDDLLFCEGDRVILVEDHPDGNRDLTFGCTGTVMYCDNYYGNELYGVWWDERIEDGHTLENNSAPPGYGWNVRRSAIRLLPERDIPEEDVQDEAGLKILIGI